MIRPLGIDNGAFVVSPDTVWYALVLLLFSASATTDTGSKRYMYGITYDIIHDVISDTMVSSYSSDIIPDIVYIMHSHVTLQKFGKLS